MNEKTKHFYTFGPFYLDPRECQLIFDGNPVPLTPKSFEALLILVENAGHLVDKDDLMRRLWPGTFVEEANLAKQVSLLRKIFSEATNGREYIETVPKRGYRFVEEVKDVAEAEAGSQPQTIPGTNLTGKKISHYRVLEMLGGGGMGVVYKAEDLKLGRFVALKFLPEEIVSDAKVLERFEREARAASALDHPNICTIHEFGEHDGRPFIAMSLLEGHTLRDAIVSRPDPLATDELLNLAIQIGDGLAAAHEKGIIHRDIKPANIFITNRNEAKILDFGLAKLTDAGDREGIRHQESQSQDAKTARANPLSLSLTGVAMGTAPYMSPEQVRNERLDARSDLFSFGLVLYEMATGEQAFSGDTAAVLHGAILNRIPVPARELNPELPPKLEEIITRALEKDRNLRYQHAADMRTDLQRLKNDSVRGRSEAVSVPSVPEPLPVRVGKLWKIGIPVLIGALLVGVGLYYLRHQKMRLTETDTIVLTDFANSTSDAVFDDALNTALNISLRQSPFLDLLSESDVAKALQLMATPAGTKLTPKIAREVCLRAGSKAYVAGSIGSLGDDYVLGLKAVNCRNGDILAQEQVTAPSKEKVVEVLGKAASKLRGELGESLATVQKYDTPLSQATTPSLEALQAYSTAGRTWRSRGDADAIPQFKHALELDPTFAVGYADLGTTYCNLGETALCAEYVTEAYQLRQRVTEKERFYIDSNYYMYGTGELEKAADVFREWKQVYPRDLNPYINYGLIASNLGWLDAALSSDQEAFRLSKDSLVVYRNLSFDYLSLNRLDEAGAILVHARAHKMDMPLLPNSYQLAFLHNDAKEMERCLSVASGKPAIESAILASQADTEAYQGHLKQARDFSRRAVAAALLAEGKEDAAGWQVTQALREAEFGNADQARQDAKAALALSASRNVQVAAALAFARAGDFVRAKAMVDDLQKRFPIDTLLSNYWLPSIRAAIALSRKNAPEAIAYLQAASPYELGGGMPPFSSGGTMYPAYLRGQSYLEAKQWQPAAIEFRNILDHRGLVWNFPLGALAYLQLGRTYAGSGDVADARVAYQAFLTLWHDSDADIPSFRRAKAEFTQLK